MGESCEVKKMLKKATNNNVGSNYLEPATGAATSKIRSKMTCTTCYLRSHGVTSVFDPISSIEQRIYLRYYYCKSHIFNKKISSGFSIKLLILLPSGGSVEPLIFIVEDSELQT